MLANPDIAPSASVNWWIVSILTFHFTLVHIPGTMHGPDSLLRRPRQPGDIDDDDDDFNDWIDNLHSFIHQVQTPPSAWLRTVSTYELTEGGQNFNGEEDDCSIVPRSRALHSANEKLEAIRQFLRTLVRPPDLSDSAYKGFIKFCLHFFLDGETLWRKDTHRAHKLVIGKADRL
ncbi:uncharacterized protein FIBRA_09263 [Fibroporia radiculosa]|uniref:Uncharacterized protein n=1 Tax=Fibroporia radiculosa TaxID=599839 RepID=J7S673_9APHY|nr:uncharacterized protein FIBRA_09263 [Fibroporia radiculosa]CCM06949.1 predicted protein [Fibroporia radiculosa]